MTISAEKKVWTDAEFIEALSQFARKPLVVVAGYESRFA
jgi:hypothetical protein